MRKLFRPKPDWGPALDIHRKGTRYEENVNSLPLGGFTNLGFNSWLNSSPQKTQTEHTDIQSTEDPSNGDIRVCDTSGMAGERKLAVDFSSHVGNI